MEGRKQSGSSSFTSDLFGPKESSSSGVLGSIFSPTSKASGQESVVGKKQGPASQVLNTKGGPSGSESISSSCEAKNISSPDEERNSFYKEEKMRPCNFSSSIYYGGQDAYFQPHNTKSSDNTTFTKDGGEDDSGAAVRGNWWQGSLYY